MDQINIPDSLNLPWEKHSEMRKQESSSDSLDVNAKRNHDLTLYSQTGKAGCSNFTLKNNETSMFQKGLPKIFNSAFMINSQKQMKVNYCHF